MTIAGIPFCDPPAPVCPRNRPRCPAQQRRLLALRRHRSMSTLWSLLGGLCCKTIFRIRARKIDSRSRVNAQHRFKNSFAPIRLLRISIPQLLRGDFCNTIPPKADLLCSLSFVRLTRRRSRGPRKDCLFDHLVGQGEEFWGNCKAERFRGPEIDHQLELSRLNNW